VSGHGLAQGSLDRWREGAGEAGAGGSRLRSRATFVTSAMLGGHGSATLSRATAVQGRLAVGRDDVTSRRRGSRL